MDHEQWHLDKKVPISIIVTLLIMASTAIWSISDIKKDVELLKAGATTQHERDDRQDRAVNDAIQLVRETLREMNAKLDRLVERSK